MKISSQEIQGNEEMINSPEMPLDDNDHNYSKEKLKLLVPRKPEGSQPSKEKKEKTRGLGSSLDEILTGSERVKERNVVSPEEDSEDTQLIKTWMSTGTSEDTWLSAPQVGGLDGSISHGERWCTL